MIGGAAVRPKRCCDRFLSHEFAAAKLARFRLLIVFLMLSLPAVCTAYGSKSTVPAHRAVSFSSNARRVSAHVSRQSNTSFHHQKYLFVAAVTTTSIQLVELCFDNGMCKAGMACKMQLGTNIKASSGNAAFVTRSSGRSPSLISIWPTIIRTRHIQ